MKFWTEACLVYETCMCNYFEMVLVSTASVIWWKTTTVMITMHSLLILVDSYVLHQSENIGSSVLLPKSTFCYLASHTVHVCTVLSRLINRVNNVNSALTNVTDMRRFSSTTKANRWMVRFPDSVHDIIHINTELLHCLNPVYYCCQEWIFYELNSKFVTKSTEESAIKQEQLGTAKLISFKNTQPISCTEIFFYVSNTCL